MKVKMRCACAVLLLALSVQIALALQPNGVNVIRVTSYKSVRYTTSCGLFGWGRCTRYRRQLVITYKCKTGYTSTDNIGCPHAESNNIKIDLTSGAVVGADSAISWTRRLSGSGKCAKQGVLKLTFGPPNSSRSKVRIDMWFDNPTSWVFNIGDSPSNNGYGGDSGTTSRDAEIQGIGSTFDIHGNDYNSPKGGRLLRRRNVISTRFSVIIANGLVIWNNWGVEFNYMYNVNTLYALNGQPDRKGGSPNYDIYFGMNRVVGGGRTGKGLCRATVTWL